MEHHVHRITSFEIAGPDHEAGMIAMARRWAAAGRGEKTR